MRYMMIVKGDENLDRSGPPPQALFEAIGKLGEEAAKAGKMVSMGGLKRTADGARIRINNGKLTITDGPFTEAKEVIGGFWMIEVASRAEAIEWARKCPATANEMIEIRQVQEMADFSEEVQQAAATFEHPQGGWGKALR